MFWPGALTLCAEAVDRLAQIRGMALSGSLKINPIKAASDARSVARLSLDAPDTLRPPPHPPLLRSLESRRRRAPDCVARSCAWQCHELRLLSAVQRQARHDLLRLPRCVVPSAASGRACRRSGHRYDRVRAKVTTRCWRHAPRPSRGCALHHSLLDSLARPPPVAPLSSSQRLPFAAALLRPSCTVRPSDPFQTSRSPPQQVRFRSIVFCEVIDQA